VARILAPGWRLLVLATAAFLIIPPLPTALAAVLPITETWVILAALLAICAALSWWNGGGAPAAVMAAALGGLAISAPVGTPGSAYGELARGWILMLAAAFGVVSLLAPEQRFFPRAVAAIALAVSTAALVIVAVPGAAQAVRRAASGEFQRRTSETVAVFRGMTASPAWRDAAARSPGLDTMAIDNERQLQALPAHGARLLPALLGVESLAALALAWALYQRVARSPAGPALGPVREFRFNDQLIWGLAAGGVMYVLPGFQGARTVGANLLLFFGVLYLLRGVGVLAWVSRGRWVGALLIVLTILAPHLLAALALGVGIADTWMDWRTRARSAV